jgi:hypothetical protein
MSLIDSDDFEAATVASGWHVLELTRATVGAVAVTELDAVDAPLNHRHFHLLY